MERTFTVLMHPSQGQPHTYQLAHNSNMAKLRGREWVYLEGLDPAGTCTWCDWFRAHQVDGNQLEPATARFFLLKNS